MSERGVFAVDRGIWTDPDFAEEPFTEREAFLWLVSEAAWKAYKKRADGKVVDLERGQLCHSVRFMAEAWQWSKSRVDRFLARLENRDIISRDSGTRTPVLTICKYDCFQRVSLPERDNIGTTSGTRTGQERDKLEDIENIKSTSLRSVDSESTRKHSWPSNYQEVVWALYPKKAEKKASLEALAKIHKADKLPFETITAGIAALSKNLSDPQYAPALHRWLRNERWNDEYGARSTPPPRQPPRQSAAATFLDIARQADNEIRSPSHEQPLDGEILGPGYGVQATRYPHLTVIERTGADGGELQPEDHSGERRTFG